MIRVPVIALFAMLFISFSANAYGVSAVRDSIGVERKNGKIFIKHKVVPKETLYALSRKYGVSVAQIVEANPKVQNSINIDQVVLIPWQAATAGAVASVAKTTSPGAAPAASNRTFTVTDSGNKMHKVEPKQTLFSISRMHGVSVDDLKRWNNLSSNNISVGSSLIVGKGVAAATKKPVYVPEADDEMVKPKASEPVATKKKTEDTDGAVAEPVVLNERITEDSEESAAEVKKIIETGMAETIDPKADSNKYLAMHRTAPVGTIMQVKNISNGQVVYVRVVGKLPEIGSGNDKVVVRVSKKAYEKLNATGDKFKVEVSYMP